MATPSPLITQTSLLEIQDILTFWFIESHPKNWFKKDPTYDQKIKDRFLALHKKVAQRKYLHWRDTAAGCLAEIIILDQFSRNMFRDTAEAFAYDDQAVECANHALAQNFAHLMTQQEKNFLYLPLEHQEDLKSQNRAIELYKENGDAVTLDYAYRHQEVIQRFGRFPHRNKILGRKSTPEEEDFLKQPGSRF